MSSAPVGILAIINWSRRINDEHRLVYTFLDDELVIVQCRYHYDHP